ncbi:ABC transporter substrate-binding protein [Desulfonema ishimotonii]|uniref:Thiamine pyrimidine synthase n=1 Tax=Desulfonema ishimotonii TaxID=45657 RepID=A0A401FW48_9BACT|nr:ABC transporter substrate-binding protein [Desulfonema ishimotonii]
MLFTILLTLLTVSAPLSGLCRAGTLLKPASFTPQWFDQAQFAGYYVAREKGFYQKHGIALTLIRKTPGDAPYDLLKKHRTDFTLMPLVVAIQQRALGVRLVSIAQIFQTSGLMLIGRASAGLRTPADISGKKVGGSAMFFQMQFPAFSRRFHLQVRPVIIGNSVNLFLREGIDLIAGMEYNQYHTIINSGYDPEELTVFRFRDYGMGYPGDGIYTLEETWENDPALCIGFVRAALEGWRYAMTHPDEAVDIVMDHIRTTAHLPADMAHQKWMLKTVKDLFPASRTEWGKLSEAEYLRAADALKQGGIIEQIPGFRDFYKNGAGNAEE